MYIFVWHKAVTGNVTNQNKSVTVSSSRIQDPKKENIGVYKQKKGKDWNAQTI